MNGVDGPGTCDQREEGKEAEGSLTTQIQEVIIGAQHSSPQERLVGRMLVSVSGGFESDVMVCFVLESQLSTLGL